MVNITSYKTIRGLDLNSNGFVPVPGKDFGSKNSTVIADNCVLSRQRMIGNRKGFDYFGATTPNRVDGFAEYQSTIIEHESDGSLFRRDPTTGTRNTYSGNFIPPSPYRFDSSVGRGSLFFTSTQGTQKIDAVANNPIRAGLTKGLDTRGSVTGTGNGFMNGFSKVAYRITWTRTDANNQTLRSDVSTRFIVTNNTRLSTTITSAAGTATATTASAHGFTTGDTILIAGAVQTPYNGSVVITVTGATTFTYVVAGGPVSPATGAITSEKANNVSLTFSVPADVRTGDSYEVWRTITKDASNADPGDDCFLVSRTVNVTAASATVTFVDVTLDTIISAGTPLYTNATQEGALQGNSRPPVCSAIATYKDFTIYANSALDHQITISMLASINFIQSPTASFSTLILTDGTGSRTYTCAGAENVSTQTWQQFTGGISNAANIENTTRSICHVINGDTSGRWYAEYSSGINDNPGIFRVWARNPISGPVWFQASTTTTGNQFSPAIPTSGQTVITSNDARVNRMFISKFQSPDHVPILNFIDCGRLDQPILRVLTSREALYVIKSDGIYYVNGLNLPFSLIELDLTCRCIAPASAVQLNNVIYMLSNQGVVKVSLSGVTVISFDIEPIVMVKTLALSNLAAQAFAIANESERHYILYLPQVNGDTSATNAYIFHTFISEWVRWTNPASAGIALNSNYTLYLSSGLENAILKERRNGDNTDYSDQALAVTVTGQTALVVTVTWASGVYQPSPGLTLHQGASISKVLSVALVTGITWNFTIDRTVSYSNGAATARLPIFSQVRLSANPLGEIGQSKSIYEVAFILDSDSATMATLEVATNEAPVFNQYTISRILTAGWGSAGWGETPWGDVESAAKTVPWAIDLPIPDCTGESVQSGWYHSVSQEQWIIAQVSVTYDRLAEYEVTQ